MFDKISEEEQRWGQSGRNIGSIDMRKLREETEKSDADKKKKQMEEGPNASRGYGGKFGVEKDRMDKCAVGHDHIEKLEKHTSQKGKNSNGKRLYKCSLYHHCSGVELKIRY